MAAATVARGKPTTLQTAAVSADWGTKQTSDGNYVVDYPGKNTSKITPPYTRRARAISPPRPYIACTPHHLCDLGILSARLHGLLVPVASHEPLEFVKPGVGNRMLGVEVLAGQHPAQAAPSAGQKTKHKQRRRKGGR